MMAGAEQQEELPLRTRCLQLQALQHRHLFFFGFAAAHDCCLRLETFTEPTAA
jgi:hypothetical protein